MSKRSVRSTFLRGDGLTIGRNVSPILGVLATHAEAFEAIEAKFGNDDLLRRLIIGSLSQIDVTLPLASRLLLDWNARGVGDIGQLVDQVTARFVQKKQYSEAFRLFRTTHPLGPADESELVYNARFDRPLSGNVFDWQMRSQAGVDIRIADLSGSLAKANPVPDDHSRRGDRKALSIRFLDNPIQFRNVSELVRLSPGPYRLSVTYEADTLEMPKPLKLGVSCYGKGPDLGTITFKSGDLGLTTAQSDFSVPDSGCELQQLLVYNDPMPMSWQNRYSGVLILHQVSLARAGS